MMKKGRALKLMLLGELGVGKTSIAKRLVFNTFDASYKATIGVDIFDFTLSTRISGLDIDVNLLIWDIDGEYAHDIFRHIYMEGACGSLIVSDLSRPPTQKAAFQLWAAFAREFPGRPAIVALNKSDLVPSTNAVVPAAFGIDTIWTSAKTGDLVFDAFVKLARECASRGLSV
jgi:small GTP-binding protein